jgi:signal transduction histidine kinase
MSASATSNDAELFRREAMGAFAHEVRTPLTSIRMVMELARRQSGDGPLVMDAELAEMLASSVDDLQRLADDLQEGSRLERGKLPLSRGPCDLRVAIEAARAIVRMEHIELEGPAPAAIDGPWDAARLVRAIADFAESTNRVGDGSGVVRFGCTENAAHVCLTFASGTPGAEVRPITADAGFAFFHSRQIVLAMGGSVRAHRAERYATITVALPMAGQ